MVAHAVISPDLREYPAVEGAAMKYEYDLRRAAQMIEALGYSKGGDGMYADASGRKLQVEIRSTTLTETGTLPSGVVMQVC